MKWWMNRTSFRGTVLLLACCVAGWMGPPARAQMGHVLDAVGPVNQSMGGAGTALPLDSIGALHWNPASITALRHSEFGFSMDVFASDTRLASRVNPGAFGPGFPPVTLSGKTSSDIDINPMPAFGFVCAPDDSPWSYGLGGFAIAGFGVDFPASNLPPNSAPSATNPILTPQPPSGMGFGALYSSYQMMQVSPAIACRVSDRFSVGFAPTFNWTSLGVTPFPAAAPDDAGGNGFASYPDGSRSDSEWGLGFQAGVFYENVDSGWNLGASYTSTQWINEYKINSHDELGFPRQLTFDMDFPAIYAVGIGFTGFACWDLALDVKYVDYNNTDGFRATGFAPDGSLIGFGWNSILAVSMGAQYHVTDCLRLRMGYTFNENPIADDITFFNIHAPAIVQHHASAGFSWDTPHDWTFAFSFTHAFSNSISGQWQSPAGPIPGTSVTSRLATYSMTGGFYKRY